MAIKLMTLDEASAYFSGAIKASTLRAEVHDGKLIASRARESHSATILIDERDLLDWYENHARGRGVLPFFAA